ncbi:MAG: ROK family protein [Burkholderiaceae bacterium]
MNSPTPLPNAAEVIGVDLGGTKIEAIVLDTQGASLWRERVATPAGDYGGTLTAIAQLVRRAETERGLRLAPVGVGTPGSLTRAGLIRNANSTCLNGRALGRDLECVLGRAVRIANDANCLALSEAGDGAAAGADVVFAAILGTGVGGGIVAHGRLLTGANGLAGEWGHNPLPWSDAADAPAPGCYCGRRGCIESWLSGPGLARDHARHAAAGASSGNGLDALQIGERAALGNAACIATLERHALRLARALAAVINLLDPDVIVLGGGVSNLEHLIDRVTRHWGDWVFNAGAVGAAREPPRTRLVRSQHGDSSGVRGAAWLWRGTTR